MVDEGAEEAARRSLRAWLIGVVIIVSLVVGGWLAIRTISAVVCADYNSISNDFCDEWHYDTPPDDAIPVPQGWRIAWEDLDCGSGGCPYRRYVLVPPERAPAPIDLYVEEIGDLGWRPTGNGNEVRKDDLTMVVELASENVGLLRVPRKLGRPGFIYVALGICGEARSCE